MKELHQGCVMEEWRGKNTIGQKLSLVRGADLASEKHCLPLSLPPPPPTILPFNSTEADTHLPLPVLVLLLWGTFRGRSFCWHCQQKFFLGSVGFFLVCSPPRLAKLAGNNYRVIPRRVVHDQWLWVYNCIWITEKEQVRLNMQQNTFAPVCKSKFILN